MIQIALLIFVSTFSVGLSCDWDVINIEPESQIYYIHPMNEQELVSYSFDKKGNMFYQYSSDNGSTWEIIREEKSEIDIGGTQPDKVRHVLVANRNTILFFRHTSYINSYNTETKKWEGIKSQSEGSKVSDRHYYKDNGKIIVQRSDIDENGNEVPYLFIADTSNPLNFERKRMFAKDFPLNTSYMQNLGIRDSKYYFWYYKPSAVYDSIGVYDINTQEVEYLVIKDTIQYIDKLYFIGDDLYFSNYKFLDDKMTKQANVGFYKYDSEKGRATELYRFDHSYHSIPELTVYDESTYSLRINSIYYLFENDEFYKKANMPDFSCEDCNDIKVALTYNHYNDYFYYTTKGSCLFRSSDFYNDLLDPETSVRNDFINKEVESFILTGNSLKIDADSFIQSTKLFDIKGKEMYSAITNQSDRTVELSFNQGMIPGVYYLITYTEGRTKTYKILKL